MGNLVGERKALASAILAFYAFLFFIVAMAPPPGWRPCFAALGLVYGTGFFALVAGYFWARWYAIGLGLSGLISAAVSIVLWGAAVARAFDGRKEWRERFHLDEAGTHRLGKAIIRVGISLPYVVMYALAPREDAALALVAGLGGLLATAGFFGLVRMRTWSVLALAAAAALTAGSIFVLPEAVAPLGCGYGVHLALSGSAATVLLAWAVAPLCAPMWRYLRGG